MSAAFAELGEPLRVAVVTSSYNFIADGVALTLNRLVKHLEATGVEVLVFAPVARSAAFAHQGDIVEAPSWPLPFRSEYRFALGLTQAPRRRMEALDPHIIHIAVPDLLGHQALAFGLATARPVVASYHTRYEAYLRDYGLDFLREGLSYRLRKFYGACREVYVPSASMAESLLADGFRDNIHLWSRGVDTTRFHPAKRDGLFRRRHGIDARELVVTFVGCLVREKRLNTVVEVFERLRAAGVPHRGVIVGEGPDRAAMERQAPGCVFTGFLAGEDLPRAYAEADIFLFPSDTESFGNVTLEAMASGVAAVCADATGSRSLVDHGVTGLLAPPGRSEEFFEHVRRLAADEALRSRMGQAARERSLRFSWDETMARLLGRYEALAAARGRAAA